MPRWLKRTLIVATALLVLGGVVVVAADAPARATAEHGVAVSLQEQVPFTDEPTVAIEGWPFLVNLAVGFPTVRVHASGMPISGDGVSLTLTDPDFVLTGVKLRGKTITADGLTGSARISYSELSNAAGREISSAGDGRVGYTAKTEAMGLELSATVSGRLALDASAQSLTLAEPKVSIVGVELPDYVVDAVVAKVVQPIPVPLPYGIKLSSIEADADGLSLGATGENLTFALS